MANVEPMIQKQNFYHDFQPIHHLNHKNNLLGMEALFRSETGNPVTVFRKAREENLLFELDTSSILKSIETYRTSTFQDTDCQLFVNIFPSTLIHKKFDPFFEQLKSSTKGFTSNIVLEINEALEEQDLWNQVKETGVVKELQKNGFRIAFDDVGEGSFSFKHLIDFHPDYIKLARYLTTGIDVSENKQKMVSLLLEYCGNQADLILEGIETDRELNTATELGVNIGQGFLLGKPRRINDIPSYKLE